MNNLKHIRAVKRWINTLVALIVCNRVDIHLIKHTSVLTVKYFSKQEEILFLGITEIPESAEEAVIETVCNIKSDTIYIKFINPALYRMEYMLNDILVVKV